MLIVCPFLSLLLCSFCSAMCSSTFPSSPHLYFSLFFFSVLPSSLLSSSPLVISSLLCFYLFFSSAVFSSSLLYSYKTKSSQYSIVFPHLGLQFKGMSGKYIIFKWVILIKERLAVLLLYKIFE